MKVSLTLEEALAKATPRLRGLMQYSADLLRKAEKLALMYSDEGFYLAFSGGKDSQALIHMAQLAGVKYTAHFSPSSIDPPENIRFIRTHYPEVTFTKLRKSIYSVFKERKCLPSMKIRWCCKEFKEVHGGGRVTLTGVRNAESAKRATRKEVEVTGRKFSGNLEQFDTWRTAKLEAKSKAKSKRKKKDEQFDQFSHHEEQMVTCVGGNDKLVVSPIIHWLDTDVWEFLNNVVEVPHCELYDQGWTRIGCICCPMATVRNTRRDIERWPHVKEKWIKAIMEIRKEAILANTPPYDKESDDIHRSDGQVSTPPPAFYSETSNWNSERRAESGGLARGDWGEHGYPPTERKWSRTNASATRSKPVPTPPPTDTGTENRRVNFQTTPMRCARHSGFTTKK